MTLKEYLDQEEEAEPPDTPIQYSDLTKELFKQAYLDFYYWVRKFEDEVKEFVRSVEEAYEVKESL